MHILGVYPTPLPYAHPLPSYSSTYPTGYNTKGYPREQQSNTFVCNGLMAASHQQRLYAIAIAKTTTASFQTDRQIQARLPLLDTQICSTPPPTFLYISLFQSSILWRLSCCCVVLCAVEYYTKWCWYKNQRSATHIAL